ncbi:YitT family protein [Neobacillus sp. PS3-40]|uniref:YczE/YyaS/YitT family protein n=1 Tax=Neobacillus sp. PS3-40 TaxID=3070679 RepID=UPI0027DFB957|nr:YitT family protein [Neobacillus sp. PS3-40]WML44395.1 YitT family protein [Neobacillus sp. PS3-40]
MRKEWILRWSFFVFGLIILAFGIALTIEGKVVGIGPWDVFHYGMFLKLGLTIGSWSIIIGFLLLTFASIATKKLPKIGAFLNMLLLGLFIDFFMWLLPSINSLIGAIFYFILGVVLIGYGIGIYVSADLGSGPRDSIMILIVDKTGWSIQWVRNGMEVLVLILGWALGGPVGIGTVIIAFLLGPIVGFSLPQCKTLLKYMLEKKEHKKLAA